MSTVFDEQPDLGDQDLPNMDLEDRHALRRVAGLSTELQDISEVEYRALRLERVVLIGVWTQGTLASAENSMLELSGSPRRPACRSSTG
jgi:GTP-binding protein HflX